jgi:hypothetical protein
MSIRDVLAVRPVPSAALTLLLLLFVAGPGLSARQEPAQAPAAPKLTLEEQEAFLLKAKVIRTRGVNKGVTGTLRATLSDGTLTHDASIQTIDEYMTEFKSNRGVELNFRDTWRYNVAAYRLDRLLELNMIPPSVERGHQGKPASYTWWVDEVLMDESERIKTKRAAPDINAWNEQMWHVRFFDQLIYNVDRNLGNLVIDKNWTIWMIDHSRAFRLHREIKSPGNLAKLDRGVFGRLKALNEATLRATMKDYLTVSEIRSLLNRRDDIVARLEKAGPSALIDRAQK